MRIIILLTILITSSVCSANEIAEQFEKGYAGIQWKSSVDEAKSILNKRGIDFTTSTSKYLKEDLYIIFFDAETEIRLTFYKNMLSTIKRHYIFIDPDNKSMEFWKKELASVTTDLSVDNETIRAVFTVPSSSKTTDLGAPKTTIKFCLMIYSKSMMELQSQDSRKQAEKKKLAHENIAKNIVRKLINPNQSLEPIVTTSAD